MALHLPVLLTPRETAAILKVSVGTLAVVRCTKRWDLPYLRIGRAIRYEATAVAEFLRLRTVAR